MRPEVDPDDALEALVVAALSESAEDSVTADLALAEAAVADPDAVADALGAVATDEDRAFGISMLLCWTGDVRVSGRVAHRFIDLVSPAACRAIPVHVVRRAEPRRIAQWLEMAHPCDHDEARALLYDDAGGVRWDVVSELLDATGAYEPVAEWFGEIVLAAPWARHDQRASVEEELQAVVEVDRLTSVVHDREGHGRGRERWLAALGQLLPGCGVQSCCAPGPFEAELMRRGWFLRRDGGTP